MTDQDLTRVTERIAGHVSAFLSSHSEFHGPELHRYVEAQVGGYVAPGSPDRIMRMMRQKGLVNYELVSRSQSLYRALPVEIQRELF